MRNRADENEIPDADIIPDVEAEAGPGALKALREKLTACLAEKQEHLAGWQRAKADYVNARKGESERTDLRVREERTRILASVLASLDSFESAFADAAWERVDGSWRAGVENIYQKLRTVLPEHGVEPFGEAGEAFDPRRHEPVTLVSTDDPSRDHTVAEVIQRGYEAKDGTVIRPARVTVFAREELSAS